MQPSAQPRTSPQRRIEGLIADWRTTPGRLRIARIGIVLGVVLAGVFAVVAANARADTMRDIAERLEPLNAHASILYRSLAGADTAVAVGFLAGRVEPRDVRARYDSAVEQATIRLIQAARQASGEQATADQITAINKQLPVYTGLVERARANNRQGLPVGVAYLRLASDLMQKEILPQAAELQRQQAARLDDAYRRAESVPVVALAACGVSLAGLIWAQIFLFRRTHRVINVGLITASVAVLAGLVWWTAAAAVSGGTLADSQRHNQSVSQALGPAQIAALEARTIESLGLVRTGTATEDDFNARMHRLGLAHDSGALDAARAFATDQTGRTLTQAADDAASKYASAHRTVRQFDESAHYAEAIKAATAFDEPTSAAMAFDELDTALRKAIDHERRAFGQDIQHAQRHLTGLPVATGAFSVLAAVGVALGIRRRLEEYR